MNAPPNAWLAAAREDEEVAKAVARFAPAAAAVHWQQASEKRLKALLSAADIEVPRAHDLLALWNRLAAHGLVARAEPDWADALRRLSRLAVLGRHPLGGIAPSETVTRQDLAEAEALAGRLAELVDGVLARLGRTSEETNDHAPRSG